MTRIIIVLLVGTLLIGCSNEKVYIDEIDKLITKRLNANDAILTKIKKEVDDNGLEKASFDMLIGRHNSIKLFIDSLNGFNDSERFKRSEDFFKRNFSDITLQYPFEIGFDQNTPSALIKLFLVNAEDIYLREWRDFFSIEMNFFEAIITTDKCIYKKDEKINGKVFMSTSTNADRLDYIIKLNGKALRIEKGKGVFSIDPTELPNKGNGDFILNGEILLGGTVLKSQSVVKIGE